MFSNNSSAPILTPETFIESSEIKLHPTNTQPLARYSTSNSVIVGKIPVNAAFYAIS